MKYISTRGQAPALSFEQALLAGLADDGGLYMPESWPKLSDAMVRSFGGADYTSIAKSVIAPFVQPDMSAERLGEIVDEAYACFGDAAVAPLVRLGDNQYLLELFHGPTMAFKDVAMQLVSRLMDDALTRRGHRATLVCATSGDTGGAAIEAFAGREAVDLFVLFPDGRVSDVQRKQMTTMRATNVHALAIDGTFDDCQTLVKALFNDVTFRRDMSLTGVNSINWARVMAQSVYYFTAATALGSPDQPVAFSVPTGNFGDIFAGYVATQMGLPVAQLMIATNVNDILVRMLESGAYEIGEVIATASPSMDIQRASNFERLLFELTGRDSARVRGYMAALAQSGRFELAANELTLLRALFGATCIDETATLDTMRDVKANCGMQIDPHSAVGVGAARRARLADGVAMVTLATAHPAKFPEAVRLAYGEDPETTPHIADMLARMLDRKERFERLPNELPALQAYIRDKTGL